MTQYSSEKMIAFGEEKKCKDCYDRTSNVTIQKQIDTIQGQNVTVLIYIIILPSDQFNDTDGWVMHDHRRDDHTSHPRPN